MTPIAVAREVRLYVAEDDRCPYKEWLEALRIFALKPGSVNDLTAW